MCRRVIDLSKYNGRNIIDWSLIKQNVDGIIFRIGYRGYSDSGRMCIDPLFKTYLSNCVKYNIPFGVYWFAQEITKEESIESANYIYNLIKDYKLSYPIYYDVEYSAAGNQTGRADVICKSVRMNCIVAFCEEIKRLGFTPGVYANEYWFTTKLDYDTLKKYNIWCAKYNSNSGEPEIAPNINYDMWQYTDKGSIPGINGKVDLNIDMSALIDNSGIDSMPDKTINGIAVEVINGKWGNGDNRKQALIDAGYDYKIIQNAVNNLLDISDCDVVRLREDAVYTNGKSIPQWVKNSNLFIRGNIKKNGDVVISTVKRGPITGVVNKKYLIKVNL